MKQGHSNEIIELDIARGIAIYLVVLGHALDHYNRNYIDLGDWMKIWAIIYLFHMPLFFFISGIVYTRSRACPSSFKEYSFFISRKASRLLLPYFSYSFLFLILKYGLAIIDGNLSFKMIFLNVQQILINPHQGLSPYLWFVHALFIMFCVFPFVDFTCRKSLLLKFVWLAIFLFIYWEAFAVNNALLIDLFGNSIFFFLGYFISKYYHDYIILLKKFGYYLPFLFIVFIIIRLTVPVSISMKILFNLMIALSGIVSILYFALIVRNRKRGIKESILAIIGKQSYEIYLIHYIAGIYSFGIIFYKIFAFNFYSRFETIFITIFLPPISIVFSVAIANIFLNKFGFTRKYFLGKLQ